MTPEQGQRVCAIFEEVLEADPAGRAALLDELCAGDWAHVPPRSSVSWLTTSEPARDKFLTPPAARAQGADGGRRFPFRLQGLEVHVLCPHCRTPIGLVDLPVTDKEVVCPSAG